MTRLTASWQNIEEGLENIMGSVTHLVIVLALNYRRTNLHNSHAKQQQQQQQ
jgi:hypothetical protein